MNKQRSYKVVIIGTGYVGLTTGVCLAYFGHMVTCVDVNPIVINKLKSGTATIFEPGLQELLFEARANLHFTTSLREALPGAEIIFITVETPSKADGDVETMVVEEVARDIGANLDGENYPVVVNKSTVPIGFSRQVRVLLQEGLAKRGRAGGFFVVSNPEFLREGAALTDALYPDRIVVGAEDIEAVWFMRQLYGPLLEQKFSSPRSVPRPTGYNGPAFFATDPVSAELIKYASNAYLAMKISFINQFAELAEQVDADITEVARGVGLDERIGPHFLGAGIGWGGSCFGKDNRAILAAAGHYGIPLELVAATIKVNYRQRVRVVEKLNRVLRGVTGQTIGIIGLAFKPNTDDIRDSPSIDIIKGLLELGAVVKVYDPVVMPKFRKEHEHLSVQYTNDVEELSAGCAALVIATDWPEFVNIDWLKIGAKMQCKIVFDGRNMFSRSQLEQAGFTYLGVGR